MRPDEVKKIVLRERELQSPYRAPSVPSLSEKQKNKLRTLNKWSKEWGVLQGKHLIKVVKGDLIGSKSVLVKVNEIAQETIQLSQATGGLKIFSNPPEININLDGKLLGKTPVIANDIPVGEHRLSITNPEYKTFRQKVIITYNEFKTVEVKLIKLASLTIRSIPPGADVYINGKKEYKTPLTIKRIVPGEKVKLEVKMDYYETVEKILSLNEGQNDEIDVKLEKQTGRLQFTFFPNGTKVEYNGLKTPLTNSMMELPAKRLLFSLSAPGYLDKDYNINVTKDDLKRIQVNLERKTIGSALTRSFFAPGWGQAYQEKMTRSWIYGITFFSSISGTLYYTRDYNQKVSYYRTLQKEYEGSVDPDDINRIFKKMETVYSDVDKSKSIRNGFIITAGVVWVWNIIDVLVLPPAWEKKTTISSKMDGEYIN